MLIELREKGIHADSETPINVYYKDEIVGEFRADIIVEGEIIIELKAVQHLLSIHETQLVNYLTATHKDHGLLINFGGDRNRNKKEVTESINAHNFYDISIERIFLECFGHKNIKYISLYLHRKSVLMFFCLKQKGKHPIAVIIFRT